MNDEFVTFDEVRARVASALAGQEIPGRIDRLYIVRNVRGKVRLVASRPVEDEEGCAAALRRLADKAARAAGAYGVSGPERGVLYVHDETMTSLAQGAQPVEGLERVFWAERLVSGEDWWTVRETAGPRKSRRIALYSVKGGVGRSTTAAVLTRHLAGKGHRVLTVDLDLESPGISSAMLAKGERPDFGIADWFVEDAVGQGDRIVERMTAEPAWARTLEGAARAVPAHGAEPGEYLAKLGRLYLDSPERSWAERLERLLCSLESRFEPTVVLLESRGGLHDIAAAAVTELDPEDVLLFATDSESCWTDYGILFRHWRDRGLAPRIRERLQIVSALTPPKDDIRYLDGFRQGAHDIFGDNIYDEAGAGDAPGGVFSFDLYSDNAPHAPFPIYWNEGLAAGASLRDLDRQAVAEAYARFLACFDESIIAGGEKDE